MTKINELSKAFLLFAAFIVVGGLSVFAAAKLNTFWALFIVIPILVLVTAILIINSIVSIKCSNCGKEVGVRTGGLLSIWDFEKPEKCQWCGHDTV